ncbi:SsgA family sporulation/cell division regulator [Streptomyces sp. NPDC004111]|uniref:SsgA family sporulation/cell division regulator n=1 Tax=Streptomyces sp. NPDC004111 TaxID=3364690 RepID=UPI0036C77343
MSRTAGEPAAAGELAVSEPARSAFEVHLRGRLITDAAISPRIPVALRHDPADDPRAVSVVLPTSDPAPGPDGGSDGGHRHDRTVWTFPRALLEAGLRTPAQQGDVRIWPCGRVQAVLELHAARGVALVQLDSAPVVRFLRRTYA